MGTRNVRRRVQGNLIIPQISNWNADRETQFLARLAETPTHRQLAIFQRQVEECWGKSFIIDLFVLLFKHHIDTFSFLTLTPEQRLQLYTQIIKTCASFVDKWGKELGLRCQQGYSM